MKIFAAFLFLALSALPNFAQKSDEALATSSTRTFKKTDLSHEAQSAIDAMPATIAKARSQLLVMLTNDRLVETEAKIRGLAPEKLAAEAEAKAPAPTEAEIKAVYDANVTALGNRPLDAVRKSISDFLRQDAAQKALQAYIETLRAKHKVMMLKDINAAGLRPADVIFSVNGVPTQVQQFDDKYRFSLYDLMAEFSDQLIEEIEDVVYSNLVIEEAKSLNIDSSAFLAREITDKLKNYSNEETAALQDGLRKRLFAKYQIKFLYKGPEPVVQQISVDDDPSQGPADAPVTIVMFSDFQCSACSATHPVLKQVMAEYPGKIRFVVRDFPLTSIHENALAAARAANAAKDGGKFFEYIELLYKNQSALNVASLKQYAVNVGLQPAQFELSFNSEKAAAEIQKDISDGEQYGISSTPTIFVNGVRVRKLSDSAFRQAIDRALKK